MANVMEISHALMWMPALAALICARALRFNVSVLGFRAPGIRYALWSFLIPLCYGIVAYVALWLTRLAPLTWDAYSSVSEGALGLGGWSPWLSIGMALTVGVLDHLVACAGEEIGWRGYLVPILARRFGFFGITLVSGLVWSVWHMPAIIFAGDTSEAPLFVTLTCFTIMIIATGGLAAWLRLRSGSVWPCVVLHACHNTLIQLVLDRMTEEHGASAVYATEFGVGLALTSSLLLSALCYFDRAFLWQDKGRLTTNIAY